MDLLVRSRVVVPCSKTWNNLEQIAIDRLFYPDPSKVRFYRFASGSGLAAGRDEMHWGNHARHAGKRIAWLIAGPFDIARQIPIRGKD